MAKKEYRFNPKTLAYEVVDTPSQLRVYRFLRRLLIGFILASLVNFTFSFFFYTPKMYMIQKEEKAMILKYEILQERVHAAVRKIEEVKHRDQNVYRALFGVDSLFINGIYTPYPDAKYDLWANAPYAELMTETWKGIDAMGRLIYLESVSFDEIEQLTTSKEQMALCVPAIWPIDKRELRGGIGRFGRRMHPVLKVYKHHDGIDFGANKGVAVYSTANGKVTLVQKLRTGYGHQVLVDHGFGYKTRYAHLSKIDVKVGQTLKRGEKIGEVGNTGRSTGPHLHYEVIYRNRHMNPINYFRKDMTQEEFETVIMSAKETTFESD